MSPAWFQLPVHSAAPPSLHGVRKGRSPASTLLWGAATPCRPSHRASFPSLGDTIRCVPCSSPTAQDLAVDQPGVFSPVLLPADTMETARSPKFPGNPYDHSPMFLRPRCDQARWWVQVSLMPGAAPATDQDEGSRQGNFGAQSHSV